MKTVLLLPGSKENISSRPYKNLIEVIAKAGYKVKFVPINWRYTTIDDWVLQLEKEYAKHDPVNTMLAGFSFGSMIAFVEAAKRPPVELWLFSLSPYFAEDLDSLKLTWKIRVGKRRIKAFSGLYFSELVKKISSKTILFGGDEEMKRYQQLSHRLYEANKKIRGSKLIVVKGAGHDVANPKYIKAIAEAVKKN